MSADSKAQMTADAMAYLMVHYLDDSMAAYWDYHLADWTAHQSAASLGGRLILLMVDYLVWSMGLLSDCLMAAYLVRC